MTASASAGSSNDASDLLSRNKERANKPKMTPRILGAFERVDGFARDSVDDDCSTSATATGRSVRRAGMSGRSVLVSLACGYCRGGTILP